MAFGMLAEPQSIVEKVWDQVQKVQQRLIWEPKTALVLGSGPLGLLAALTCRLLGLETHVYSLSPEDSVQAKLVRGCGATYHQAAGGQKQTAGGGSANKQAAEGNGSAGGNDAAGAKADTGSGVAATGSGALTEFATGLGKHIDMIWECTGYSPLAFEAMGVLGPNGVLALLGVTPGKKTETLPIDSLNMNMVLENKCVLGSVNAARKDFETGLYRLQQMHERYPDVLAGIVTDRLRLEDVPGIDFAKFAIKTVVDVVPVEQWEGLVKQTSDVAYSFSV
jgi:threonine dehydrogenase-like Zn-dependent dehydrogenase